MSVARNFERNHMNWRQGLKKGGGASTIVHAEDSQPNETIDKRRAVPALVVPSKLQKRPNDSGWGLRGRGRGRGRGGPPNYADRRSAQYANSNAPQNPPKHIDFSRSLPVSSGPAKSAVFNSRGLQAPPNLSKGAIAPRPQPPQQRPLGATTGASRPRPPPRREPSPKPPHVPEGDPTVPISILDTFPGRLPSPSAARYSIRSSVSSIPRSPPPLKRRKFDGVSAVESIVVVPLPTSSDKAGAFLAPRPAYEKIQSKRTPAIPTSDTSQGRFLSPSASPASRILSVSSVPRSSPPLKRRRVDSVPPIKAEEPPAILTPSPFRPPATPSSSTPLPAAHGSTSSPVRIKLEARTPSPPPSDPPRRAVTSGSKRYFPVPHDCTRASLNPDFAMNRRKWAHRECSVLRALGLRVDKFFFRDDGMVIEWTSTEPVWVDTLRPTRVRSQSPVDVEIIDADAEPEESPAAQSIEIIDVDAEPTNLPPPSPPNATSLVRSPSVSSDVLVDSADPVQDEQTLMQQLSLEYIQKYILAFDHDRPALADAYTEDAIFSFRSNTRAAPAHFTFQRVRQAQLKSTMPKLPALQDYRFAAHGGVIDVDYDTVVLETQPLKIILSVHGELVGAAARRLAIDQSFVLRRAAADVDTAEDIAGQRRGAATWPLVAESHQMIVRDASGKVPVSMPWWMDS